jgi:hypothetical protein
MHEERAFNMDLQRREEVLAERRALANLVVEAAYQRIK